MLQGLKRQLHIDELARPEMALLIGKAGLEFDGAGGGIDMIVGDGHLAAVQQCTALLAESFGHQRELESWLRS